MDGRKISPFYMDASWFGSNFNDFYEIDAAKQNRVIPGVCMVVWGL